MAEPTLYEVLQLSQSASQTEVRAAYLRIARKSHPDKALDLNQDLTASSNGDRLGGSEFYKVQAAYEILSSPSARQAYDEQLNRHKADRAISQSLRPRISATLDLDSFRPVFEADQVVAFAYDCRCGEDFVIPIAALDQKEMPIVQCVGCSDRVRVRIAMVGEDLESLPADFT